MKAINLNPFPNGYNSKEINAVLYVTVRDYTDGNPGQAIAVHLVENRISGPYDKTPDDWQTHAQEAIRIVRGNVTDQLTVLHHIVISPVSNGYSGHSLCVRREDVIVDATPRNTIFLRPLGE
jgi:hypothetical protein